ncbi:MAG: hypothetical protein JW874_09175 [Spirochaetales bacterium]|nr:hypothetical protein [Spirochaetales bacterium]
MSGHTHNRNIVIGVDLGSVTAKIVFLNEKREILESHYLRHKGHPGELLVSTLKDMFTRFPAASVRTIGITGSGGKRIAKILNAGFCNEVIAETLAVSRLYDDVRSIINIGGQDSKLIHLEPASEDRDFIIENFSMNSLCAAGTGAFLDQQANRLGINIEGEFGALAVKSENPPRIAGRCSVFAKSDMIHLQQKGTPIEDIVAGLCFAMARNFKATVGKNSEIHKNVAFIGGVARNEGMVRAFREVLGLKEDELVIPEHNSLIGAIGAALNVFDSETEIPDLDTVSTRMHNVVDNEDGFSPLKIREEHLISKEETISFQKTSEKTDAFLGIDIGSISTNIVLIDRNKKILAKEYLRTGSQPIEAVKRGLREIGKDMGDYIHIIGACTTGSARYLIGDFIGADIVKDEITAHARGSREVDPGVDTIFEIGGQDSKYIRLENSVIVDFEMNKVCAAGTGSFLEEQAERLGIDIQGQFSDFALCARDPSRCGERCTVFMESDLVHHQQKGVPKEDIVAGLAYSIVYNYVNKVVEGRPIGKNIFLQGGVAFNKAVVAAFETVLEKPVTVPPNHEVMGAFGAALMAYDQHTSGVSAFKGWDTAEQEYSLRTFECQGCANQCLINKITISDGSSFFYGSRCDRYDKASDTGPKAKTPDYYKTRERLFYEAAGTLPALPADAPRIGLPFSMTMHEDYPLWKTFFNELGAETVLSDPTNKKHVNRGLESVVEETCFPIKVLHGHVLELMEKDLDFLFLPYVMDMWSDNKKLRESLLCSYVQTAPDMIRAAFDPERTGVKTLSPVIKPSVGHSYQVRELYKVLGPALGVTKGAVSKALRKGRKTLQHFRQAMVAEGRKIIDSLAEDEFAIAVISRPYNGPDRGINLDIPAKLNSLGVKAIPMDFLALSEFDMQDELGKMYWWFGHRALAASMIIRDNPKLFPIYINNFACGPDSFTLQYFLQLMGEKPNLVLEIDEHSADAGIMTRLEAFIDSIRNLPSFYSDFHPGRICPGVDAGSVARNIIRRKKTMYIPYFNDHAMALSAVFTSYGIKSEVLPPTDEKSLEWARKYTNNKECYPYILITGDIIKMTRTKGFRPDKSVFFMPSGSGVCRLNHYESMQRIVLERLGFPQTEIFAPTAEKALTELGRINLKLPMDVWTSIVATDCLYAAYRQTRPYETLKGQTDTVFGKCLEILSEAFLTRKNIFQAMKKTRGLFDTISTDKSVRKPKIGIVGEFYVRWQVFSNNNFFDLVEDLGGEIIAPPVAENMLHFNHVMLDSARRKKKYGEQSGIYLTDTWQHFQQKKIYSAFAGFLDHVEEPTIQELEDFAAPYVDEIIENEITISIGKARWQLQNGLVQGIVNLTPFTCLLGQPISALLKRLKEDYPAAAIATFKFDGAADVNIMTRLEAYMHQASQYVKGPGRGREKAESRK